MQTTTYYLRAVLGTAAIIFFLCMSAVAQETRSEISLQGTGFLTKNSDGYGIHNRPTETGGLLVGYRYRVYRWLSAEANYGYVRNTQIFSGSYSGRVQSNIHQITSSAVVKLPAFSKLEPYARAGGGALVLDPTDNAGGSIAGQSRQTRGAFLYGGGADCPITSRLAFRAEYRGYVYKNPTFGLANLKTDSYSHIAQPSVGLVFKF